MGFESLRNKSDAENSAIDIYNAWNFGFVTRADALSAFSPEMLEDKSAAYWHGLIWQSQELTNAGMRRGTPELRK